MTASDPPPAVGPGGELLVPVAWTVSSLLRAVSDAMASRFGACTVRGELSGVTRAASGHMYLNLKDAGGQIRGVMFRRAASLLPFAPADGQAVEVRGRLTIYDARGDLQLIIESMRMAGTGSLHEQFLALKDKLQREGLFAPERKRLLPAMPHRLAVVTSLAAAALADVLSALARRAPHVEVVVVPAPVQGPGAPAALILALEQAARSAVDAVILCRGGGSIEDLWAFNDEALARAVARCSVPVVCGVGHETDFTIADFVADVRAPTPTAAAELAAPVRQELLGGLQRLATRLVSGGQRRLDQASQTLDRVALRFGRPRSRLTQQVERLSLLEQRLRSAVKRRQELGRQRMEAPVARMWRAARVQLGAQAQKLAGLSARLENLHPEHVLARGYAYVLDRDDRLVGSVAGVNPGQMVQVVLRDGRLQAAVEAVAQDPNPRDGSGQVQD